MIAKIMKGSDFNCFYRLGKKFHNSKIYRFPGIIKFIIGCNDHKDHRSVKFLNFPDCLDST